MANPAIQLRDRRPPLEVLPLAEDIDQAQLQQQVEFYDQITANPAYTSETADLLLARGSARLELSLHPDTPVTEAESLLKETEDHFNNAYDHPKIPQTTRLTSGLLLSALPGFETRRKIGEVTAALADYQADLLDLGDVLAARLADDQMRYTMAHIIFPSLMLRSGLMYYPASYRESLYGQNRKVMNVETASTWHHGYVIENGHKNPIRMMGEKTRHTPDFQGAELKLSQLVDAARNQTEAPIIGRNAKALSISNRIRDWLRQDSQGEAPADVVVLLDVIGTWVTDRVLQASTPATTTHEQP